MKRIVIINALIWAAVILLTSYFSKDHEAYKFVFFLIVFASALQISLLNKLLEPKNKKSCSTK